MPTRHVRENLEFNSSRNTIFLTGLADVGCASLEKTPRTMWTQISTMEPEDKKVVDRQHPFLSSSMDLKFFLTRTKKSFPWILNDGLTCLPVYHGMKETSTCLFKCWFRPLKLIDWIQKMRWLHMELSQPFQSPEIDFTPRRKNKTEILLRFLLIFWHIYFLFCWDSIFFRCLELGAPDQEISCSWRRWEAYIRCKACMKLLHSWNLRNQYTKRPCFKGVTFSKQPWLSVFMSNLQSVEAPKNQYQGFTNPNSKVQDSSQNWNEQPTWKLLPI